MAKQVIAVGTTANDGTGDTLRDAIIKVNDNFDELYGPAVFQSISELPEYIGAPTANGEFPANIGGTIYKATLSDLAFETFSLPYTYTPLGTTSPQTINKSSGSVNAITGALSVAVTNNKVTLNSIVYAVFMTNDAAGAVKNVVVGTGTFTVNFTAGLANETRIGFIVIN